VGAGVTPAALGTAFVQARVDAAEARRELHEQRARWGTLPLGTALVQAAEGRRDAAQARAGRILQAMDASGADRFEFDADPAFAIVRVRA